MAWTGTDGPLNYSWALNELGSRSVTVLALGLLSGVDVCCCLSRAFLFLFFLVGRLRFYFFLFFWIFRCRKFDDFMG